MKLSIKQSGQSLDDLIKELPARIDEATAHIGRRIAEKALETVKGRLPQNSAWLTTYRSAIQAFESADGKQFAVAGFASVDMPAAPAETTLLDFDLSTEIAKAMNPYNPWTTDTLPSLKGSYDGNVVIRSASKSEVEDARARLRPLLGVVKTALKAAGADPLAAEAGERAYISGRLFTDIVWLAERLETGAGGFPKRSHWLPAALTTEKRGAAWGKAAAAQVESIIKGMPSPRLRTATAGQLDEFAKLRKDPGT